MTHAHYRRSSCRLCDGTQLELVVPITATPIADDYVSAERRSLPQSKYPLDMYQCRTCGHVQLLDIVPPELIFRQYSYFTGRSPGLVQHFREYARDVLKDLALPRGSLVVDIGSNDGTFLKFFQEAGMNVLGIDPATNVATAANAAGVETWPDFFEAPTVEKILATRGPAMLVTANNVYAHTDDLAGMTDAIAALLADDGVFVCEVSYLLDVIDHLLIGSIFHEHTCYHSVRPLQRFLAKHGLELIHVRRVSIQGGSLICMAQRQGGRRPVDPSVAAMLQLEEERRLQEPETVRRLSIRLNEVRDATNAVLRDYHSQGKTIAGYGAARGGTLILHHFGIGDLFDFIVDDSPEKRGLFSPGHHIPVLPTTAIAERRPDVLFILAWVHTKPIVKNNQAYLDQGGTFVSCFPQLEVIRREQ